MKGKMRNLLPVAAAAIGATWSATCFGAPFVYAAVVGRVQGSGDPFSNVVVVQNVGDIVEFQVVADMAPIGTTNTNGARTITSLTSGIDGLNSHKWDLYEAATAGIQVDFATPATLNADPTPAANDSWGAGIGANPGIPTARSGGLGNDLLKLRPIHASTVCTAIDPEVVAYGMFEIRSLGSASEIHIRISPAGAGGLRYNGSSNVFMQPGYIDGSNSSHNGTESTSDPFTGYMGLMVVPEPSSLMLVGMAAVPSIRRRRS
jgi:hypothetical protein